MAVYEEIIDKNELRAVSDHDRCWLVYPMDGLLPMTLREDERQIIISYDTTDKICLKKIHGWPYDRQLKVLIGISRLAVLTERYAFSLDPENLMVDNLEQTYILHRDILPYGSSGEARFLAEYKALVLCVLDNDHTFRDYMADFTEHLSRKKPVMAQICNSTTVQEIRECLLEERDQYLKHQSEDYMRVTKKSYRHQRFWCIGATLLILCMAMCLGYLGGHELPVLRAGKQLGEYYLTKDYEACVSVMAKIPAAKLSPVQSYMLAGAYIRMEDLSKEQRENILGTLSVKDSDLRARYWICTGRHETDEALDIARRLSDPELELYSYLQKARDIEQDPFLSGQEKHDQSEAVQSEIDKLQKKLEIPENE